MTSNRRPPGSAPGEVVTPPARDPAPLALALAILGMLAARALACFGSGTWCWSLDLSRDLSPVMGWGLWAVALALALPPVAKRAVPWAGSAGDAIARGAWPATLTAVALGVALAWFMPDRLRFVGDYMLRQGTVEIAEKPGVLFPQALPLDVLLHVQLPTWFIEHGLADANGAARWLGLGEIVLFAWLALRFARALDLRGAAALAATATLFFGGYLGMFTGFGKAFAELCVLVAWAGTSGLDVIRKGRGAFALGVAVAIAATLHRSGLGLVPAAALAWVIGWRARAAEPRVRRALLLALVAPLATLAVMVPRIVAVVRRWDAIHFRPHQVQQEGGVFAAALADARGVDILNLLVMLSPLVLVLVVVLPPALAARRAAVVVPVPDAPVRRGARAAKTRDEGAPSTLAELAFLALLALPFVAMMPFIHPAQGMFRDWDDFCASGVAVSLLVAWTVALVLRGRAAHAWLALAVVGAVAVPAVQWLEAQRDLPRGLARVHALVVGPPRRTDQERGTTWDYLGIRHFRLGNEAVSGGRGDEGRAQYALAAEAFSHAAETAPSPRILQQWGLAASLCGDYPVAREAYHRLLEKDPQNAYAWLSLAAVEFSLHDVAAARVAAERADRMHPGDPSARRLLDDIAAVESGRATLP